MECQPDEGGKLRGDLSNFLRVSNKTHRKCSVFVLDSLRIDFFRFFVRDQLRSCHHSQLANFTNDGTFLEGFENFSKTRSVGCDCR